MYCMLSFLFIRHFWGSCTSIPCTRTSTRHLYMYGCTRKSTSNSYFLTCTSAASSICFKYTQLISVFQCVHVKWHFGKFTWHIYMRVAVCTSCVSAGIDTVHEVVLSDIKIDMKLMHNAFMYIMEMGIFFWFLNVYMLQYDTYGNVHMYTLLRVTWNVRVVNPQDIDTCNCRGSWTLKCTWNWTTQCIHVYDGNGNFLQPLRLIVATWGVI